jgi:glucosamine 6-phosphate synthetase-like amidotransferase/phosphosugar isomerase protein
VHNVIIENYDSLKEILKKENIKLRSATDSEIIAHLISKFYQGNLKRAVKKIISLIEGSYGLAIVIIFPPLAFISCILLITFSIKSSLVAKNKVGKSLSI